MKFQFLVKIVEMDKFEIVGSVSWRNKTKAFLIFYSQVVSGGETKKNAKLIKYRAKP